MFDSLIVQANDIFQFLDEPVDSSASSNFEGSSSPPPDS
jgi:hypothetical protein